MNQSILTKYNEFKQFQNEYDDRRKKLKGIEEKAEGYRERLEEAQAMKNDCDLKVHRLDLLDKKLKSNASNKTQDKIEHVELQIKDLDEHIASLNEERKGYQDELDALRRDKTSTTKGQKTTKDILTEQNEKFKKELEKIQAEIKKTKNEKTNMEVEKENNEQELKRKRKGMGDESNNIDKLKKNFEKITRDLEKLRTSYTKTDVQKLILTYILIVIYRKKRENLIKHFLQLIQKSPKMRRNWYI